MPLNSGYSTLIQEFEKKRKKNELAFCKAMFATYYSHKALSENRALALGSLLIDIERGKKRADEISRMPGFMERIERFFDMRRKINGKKKILRKEARRSRKLELKRAAKRQSDLRVVKKREKVISKEKVVAMKIKAKVAKKSENKKKRLIGKRTRVLRKQKRKDLRNIKKQKAARVKHVKRVSDEKAKKRAARDKADKIMARALRLREKGAEAIHLANCLIGPCPSKELYEKALLEEVGLPIIKGTHPRPTPA